MTENLMTHRGYTGTIEVDLQNNCLFGRLLYINDLVNYEGSSVAELHSSFVVAIEDYLRLCTERGKNPDKPCSGTFNIRVGPQIHQNAALAAKKAGVSLNEYIKTALITVLQQNQEQYLSPSNYMRNIPTAAYAIATLGTNQGIAHNIAYGQFASMVNPVSGAITSESSLHEVQAESHRAWQN